MRTIEIPNGQFIRFNYQFNCGNFNRIRILDESDDILFERKSDGAQQGKVYLWESEENSTGETLTYTLIVEHLNSSDYEDDDWSQSQEKLLKQSDPRQEVKFVSYGYEDGVDGDFNDTTVNLEWVTDKPNP